MRGSWHDESQTDPLRAARVPTGRPWSRKPTVAPPSGSLRVHDAINCAIRSLHGGLSSGKRVGFPTQNAPIASPSISVPGPLSPRACRRIDRRFARKRLEHQTGLEDSIGHAGSQFSERVSEWQQGQRQELSCMCGVVKLPRGPTLGRGGIVTRAESGRATWLARDMLSIRSRHGRGWFWIMSAGAADLPACATSEHGWQAWSGGRAW